MYNEQEVLRAGKECARALYNSRRVYQEEDVINAFVRGCQFRDEMLWHPGTEIPEVEDGSGKLFVVVPAVVCDLPAFFCFFNNGEKEPWSAVHLGSGPYNLSLAPSEVERWAEFDLLLNLENKHL